MSILQSYPYWYGVKFDDSTYTETLKESELRLEDMDFAESFEAGRRIITD